MKRRLLAIAMTLAMALSLLPVTALAEGTEDRTGSEPVGSEQQVLTNEPSDEEAATDTETPVEDPEQGTEPTDEVGSGEEGTGGPGEGYIVQGRNDNYQTVADALDGGETSVKLIGDLTENIVISSDDELVLDLDEYTITNDTAEETKDTIYVELGGELTINGAGTVDNVSNGKAAIFNNGTVTLNGGKYTRSQENGDSTENSGGNSYYNILNHGVMTINEGVTVEQDGAFSSLIANGYYSYTETNERSGYVEGTNQAEPQLTINGGTFSGGINTIKNDDNAELVIYDGLITNVTQAAVQNNNVATIYGGTFEAEGYDALQNRHFNTAYNAGELTVSGGEFTGNLLTTTGATWSITGGTFSQDVSDYVADGYICEKSGDDYVVSELNADNSVAQVGDEYYATLAEAISAVETGETIVLQKDIEDCGLVNVNKSGVEFVIDFNDYELQSVSESFAINVQAGNVTLQNGTVSGGLGGINCEAGANLTLVEMDVSQRKAESGETDLSAIKNSGTVTIKSGTYNTANGTAQPTIWNFAEMVIEGGTFKTGATDSGWSVMICRGGETPSTNTKITGGTFINEVGYGITCSNGGNVEFGGTAKVQSVAPALGGNNTTAEENFTVTGGELVSSQSAAIFFPAEGELNISGGTITGLTGIHALMGDINISGGTITGNASESDIEENYPNSGSGPRSNGSALLLVSNYYTTSATGDNGLRVTITGGTFNKSANMKNVGVIDHLQPDVPKDTEFTISITGGDFSAEPEKDYIATGYAAVEDPDGTWTVGPKTDGMEASVDTPVGEDGNKTANADVGGSFNVSQSDEDGVSTDNTTIQIDVTTGKDGAVNDDVTTTNVTIASGSLTSVQTALNSNDNSLDAVEIATDVGTLTVSKAAWNTITDNAKGESVTLSISQAQAADSGSNKPLAYELTATANGEDVFAQGSTGTIKVDVPYTGESAHVYYVGGDGAEQMTTAKVESGRLTWDVTHFSTYVVTQNENSKAFTVTEDDDTVTEYTDLKAVLDAIASNTINDEVVINLVQGSTHTVDNANYDIDQNVTINGANATIEVNVSTEGSEGSHHAFQIVGDHTLTLNGVTMNITETGTGTVGTYGIDVQYGSTLVLDNADLTISNVSNATISAGSGTNPGQFKILNGSTVTATDIGGNFSNGGVWTIQNSELDINGCASHGLSADAVTVDNSIVTITNAAYRGISVNGTHGVDGNLLIMNGSTVSVENCATQALGETTFDAVRVATATGSSGKGKLQVDSTSSLTLTGENKEIEFAGFEGSGNPEIDIQGKVEGATITGIVAEHNGVGYATLDAALTAAGNNTTDKTVTLLGDVETSTAISIPEDVTLDGNGHSITATAEIANGGLLNITQDQVTVKNLTINTNGNVKYGVQFFATEGGTLDNVVINGGKYASVIVNGATGVTIKNSELNPETDKNAYANIEYALTDSSKTNGGIPSLTVDNVTFTSGIYQIWADETTTKFVGEKMVGSPTNTQIRDEINGSITNLNSDDITVTMRLPNESSNTSSTVDGTDDDDNGGGSHGGGSSVTRYNVTVEDTDNGSIRVSPSRASRGQTVTITVSPDDGYELDRLVVRDADGDRIDVERQSDTRYTFEMPRSRVTVEATFAEIVEEDAIPFRDVDTDDWFYDAVVYAYDTGLMSGVSDREFAPNSTLTRAMVAQMLWALEDKPQVNYLMAYDDVDSGAWFGEAVRWASSEGLMSGYSDTAFGPNDPVTREQLALILYNYARDKGYDVDGGRTLGSYLDADSVSVWAVSALEWAVDAGLISGRGEGLLAPSGTATRAEVAQIFMNFLENVAR